MKIIVNRKYRLAYLIFILGTFINCGYARILFGNFMPRQVMTKSFSMDRVEDKYKSQVLTYLIEFEEKSDDFSWRNNDKSPATRDSKKLRNVNFNPDFHYKVDLPGTQQKYYQHAQKHLDHEINGYFEVNTNKLDLKTIYNVANENSGFVSDTKYAINDH